MLRRRPPVLLAALGVAALLVWYVVYMQLVVGDLRVEANRQAGLYARAYNTVGDPRAGQNEFLSALVDVIQQYQAAGVPMIMTDPSGTPTDKAALPFSDPINSPRVREYVAVLDRQNVPLVSPDGRALHYGDGKLVRRLRIIPSLQVLGALLLAGIGVYAIFVRTRADREQVWAGMARESAHQLGTPLTSISGWIALLDDEVAEQGARAGPTLTSAVKHMKADLERLERVAHRFERIGRPPRRDAVDVGELAERIAAYFRARVPTRNHAVTINVRVPPDAVVVLGDAVLLEWVLEALTKNAVDALAGRGGTIDVSVEQLSPSTVRVRVADDGPGIPRDVRRRIFDAGFTTKERGWGIGLSLARRIVQENHGGRLALAAADRGAAFDVILH